MIRSAAGGKAGEEVVLAAAGETQARYGRFDRARELTRQAAYSAERYGAKEAAALYLGEAVLREAEAGNRERARMLARSALTLARDRDVEALAAVGLARAGEPAMAQSLAAQLNQEFPLDTLAQHYLDTNHPRRRRPRAP